MPTDQTYFFTFDITTGHLTSFLPASGATSPKVAPGDNPRCSRTKPTASKPSFGYMLTSTGPTFFSPNAFLSSKVQSLASTILVLELLSPWLHLRQAHPPS